MLSYTVPAVTEAEALAYVSARGLTGWPVAALDQTRALRRGQDYVAREYNARWSVTFTDATVPDVVKFAIVEAALVDAKSPGSLSPVVTAATAKILTQVGSIHWTPVSGKSTGAASDLMKPILTNVEAMLRSVAYAWSRPSMLVV